MFVETVTVDEAIKRGRRLLFFTPLVIAFIILWTMIGSIYLLKDGSIWIPVLGFSSIALAPLAAALYYFKALPAWRIWAFTNVRNVHELKQRAILGQIYPKDNSFLWRMEIKNAAQKEAIEELQKRFDQPDIFNDDQAIPSETSYSYSKAETYLLLLLALVSLTAAVIWLPQGDKLVGGIALAGSIMFGVAFYKRFKNSGPQLTLSNEGITTKKYGFHPWKDVANEQVFYVSAGKASYYGLSYDANGEAIKISLRDLTGLSSYKVDHVLRTYRGRYETGRQYRPSVI